MEMYSEVRNGNIAVYTVLSSLSLQTGAVWIFFSVIFFSKKCTSITLIYCMWFHDCLSLLFYIVCVYAYIHIRLLWMNLGLGSEDV